jgi:hypothetical protein
MLHELVFHHLPKNKKRYFVLSADCYRIGKSLDNDIVLLEADAPPYLGMLEKKDTSYILQRNGKSIELNHKKFQLHGYELSVLNHQHWVFALAFMAIFSLALLFFQWTGGMRSNGSLSTIKLPARGTYGNIDSRHISSLEFEFQSDNSKYLVLHYTSGNLSSSKDLQIQINDQFVAYSPASPGLWNVEQAIYIPKNLIKSGLNIGHFKFISKPLAPWAVRDIYIEELNEEPFQQNGMDLIKTAQKLFRERGARKGNLVRAQQTIVQAQQFYLQKNESLPNELNDVLLNIQSEKKQMIQDHKLLIQKYKRQGEIKKASKVYTKLLNELIDPMDPDRREFESEQRNQG